MPKSKSMSSAPAASFGGLPKHPALNSPDPLLSYRMGSEEPFRLPDAFNAPTASTVLRSEYTLSSDANGDLVFGELYALSGAKSTWVVTAGVTAASPSGTAHPQLTQFTGEARAARCNGIKIQVLYVGATLESAGYLSFTEKYSLADVNSTTIDSIHTGSLRQVAATDGLIVHIDFVQEPRFEAPSTSTFMLNTFPLGVFAASGLPPSKPVYRVRVLRFMEYLPLEGALAEGELKHEPYNNGAMGAHSELSGDGTSIATTKEYGSTFMSKVRSVANAAYHMAVPMIKPYVVPAARSFLASNFARASLASLPMLL